VKGRKSSHRCRKGRRCKHAAKHRHRKVKHRARHSHRKTGRTSK
jgi:hypothetical protein